MNVKRVVTTPVPWSKPSGEWTGRFPGWMWKELQSEVHGASVSMWKLAPGQQDEEHVHADGDEHVFILN